MNTFNDTSMRVGQYLGRRVGGRADRRVRRRARKMLELDDPHRYTIVTTVEE